MHGLWETGKVMPDDTCYFALMGGDELVINMVQAHCKLVAFSLVSYTLIVTEFIAKLRTCVGMKVDISECTTKPDLPNSKEVSITSSIHCS